MRKFLGILVCTLTIVLMYGALVEASDYWDQEEIPVLVNFDEDVAEEDVDLAEDYNFEEENGIYDIDELVHQILEEEKDNIYRYFEGEYGIDVSKKLNQLQDVYYFFEEDLNTEIVNGYVLTTDNTVHLNINIIKDELLLRDVMVHEILHYLGVVSAENDSFYLMVEGFADALTEQILSANGEEFVPSAYETQRLLSEQLLIADKGFVEHFLSDEEFNVGEYFNKKVSEIPQKTFRGKEELDDVAECLEWCIQSVYNADLMTAASFIFEDVTFSDWDEVEDEEGINYDEYDDYYEYYQTMQQEYFYYMLQAQYIVSAYCRACNPTDEQIEQIRFYQLFDWLEEMEFVG